MSNNSPTVILRMPESLVGELTIPTVTGGVRVVAHTTEEWNSKPQYIPQKGSIVVYTDHHVVDGVNYPGMKFGDGLAYVVDLPFVGEETSNEIIAKLDGHMADEVSHMQSGEREYWNNKLDYQLDGESLILAPREMEV